MHFKFCIIFVLVSNFDFFLQTYERQKLTKPSEFSRTGIFKKDQTGKGPFDDHVKRFQSSLARAVNFLILNFKKKV